MGRILDLGQPINRNSGLNTSLLAWWLGIPNRINAISFYDLCGKSHAALVNGAKWERSQSTRQGRYHILFDGTDDYVDCGSTIGVSSTHLQINGEMTVSAWIQPRSNSANGHIISNYNGGNNSYIFDINRTVTRIGFGWDNVPSVVLSTTAIPASNIPWYHVVATRTGVTGNWQARIFVNGMYENVGSSTSAPNGNSSNTTIGRLSNAATQYFNGFIDDVRLYTRPLSDAEIYQLYWDSLTGYTQTLNFMRGRSHVAILSPQFKPGNMYPQRYFTKRYFPGRYWTNPLKQLEQYIGTVYNKEYVFSVLIDNYKQTNVLANENFDIYLAFSKNLTALLNANYTITEDLIKNINSLINTSAVITFDVNKLTNAQINSSHEIVTNLNKNTNALISSNHSITIDLLVNLLNSGITLKDFVFVVDFSLIKQTNATSEATFGMDVNCSTLKNALINKTFTLDVDLVKSLIAQRNESFGISLNSFLNTSGLKDAKFPITIALDQASVKNYLKNFSFPIIVDISTDKRVEFALVDIEGVDNKFWCIIKKINTDVAVDMIQTWTEGKSINNSSSAKTVLPNINASNINISIKKV